VGVKRGRKTAADTPAWAIILKKALVKIKGQYAKEKEEKKNIFPSQRPFKVYSNSISVWKALLTC
jgi:hypothetical protein